MKRLYVLLSAEAWEALVRVSARELRHPSAQAAYILREALLGGGPVAPGPQEPPDAPRANHGRRRPSR